MRSLIVILILFFTALVFADDGVVFATEDDIRAFDQLIQERQVKSVVGIERKENRVIRELLRVESAKYKRNQLVENKGAKEHVSPSISSAKAKTIQNSGKRGAVGNNRRSWSERGRKERDMRRERKEHRHKKKD